MGAETRPIRKAQPAGRSSLSSHRATAPVGVRCRGCAAISVIRPGTLMCCYSRQSDSIRSSTLTISCKHVCGCVPWLCPWLNRV